MRSSVLTIVLLAAAVGCFNPAAPPGGFDSPDASPALSRGEGPEASGRAHLDLREERASLVEAAEELSDAIERRGIVAALGAAFTHNVQFLSPRMPIIQGAAAATTFLASGSAIAPSAMHWDVLRADVSSDGAHGYTWTQGSFTIDLGGGVAQRPGIFLLHWERGTAGSWHVAAMVFNLRTPEPLVLPAGFGSPTTKHRRYFPNTEAGEQRAALLAADAAFSAMSLSHGTGPAFAAFAARDAIATSNGAFVVGPAAIGQAFTLGPDDVVSWAPTSSGVAATGDLGFTVGDASFFLAQPNVRFYTKYLTVWQKQDNGEWKFVADLGSSRPAP